MPSTGLIYDPRLLLHRDSTDPEHVEGPDRIRFAYDMLVESGLAKQCVLIPIQAGADLQDIVQVHGADHIKLMSKTAGTPLFVNHDSPGRQKQAAAGANKPEF